MVKKKIKWEVSIESDKDLENLNNLYAKSCERCRNGNRIIGKTCADCIVSKNNKNFILKKGL